jgi:uncharacterized NAD-dependent epimerase/dehydratase family protein
MVICIPTIAQAWASSFAINPPLRTPHAYMKQKAIVLTNGLLASEFAKTCHGLLRGTERFEILAVIDHAHAGQDAGEVMDGRARNIPVFASVQAYFSAARARPEWCIVGVALPGGALPADFRRELIAALEHDLSIVCGLHTLLGEDEEFSSIAAARGLRLLDIRKPRPAAQLKFWSGEIFQVRTARIAVLGTDCAIGKRTTCRFLLEACRAKGIAAEMIYTGQTGWMQGYRHGFIFDSTLNDFIGGEIERVIVECARESKPDLILIEGQSALRNPSGPCGSEFLLSGNVKGVVLQHAPGRRHFEDTPVPLPSLASEVELIRFYGAEVLAVTLNGENMRPDELRRHRDDLTQSLGIPAVIPLEEGVMSLLPLIQDFMYRQANEA